MFRKDHLLNTLKSAHKEGIIDKEKYKKLKEQAVQQKKQEKGGEPVLIGEVRVIKKDGVPYISFRSGEITMPVSTFYEIIKETDDFISILTGKKFGVRIEGISTPEKNEEKPKEEKTTVEEKPKSEERKKEVELKEIKKEFDLKPKEKKEEKSKEIKEEIKIEPEKKKEVKPPEIKKPKKPGLLKRILGLAKEETEEQKLLRLTMENLSKVRNIQDKRRAIIETVHVLKDFLEVKMKIAEQLTYEEIIEELKKRKLDPKLRQEMIEFFNRINIEEYATGFDNESFENVYNTVIDFINRSLKYKFEKIEEK